MYEATLVGLVFSLSEKYSTLIVIAFMSMVIILGVKHCVECRILDHPVV